VVAGVFLPYPPDAEDAIDREPTDRCAADLRSAIERMGLAGAYRDIPNAHHRECLVATLYRLCVDAMVNTHESAKEKGLAYDKDLFDARKAASETADAFVTEKCPGKKLPGSLGPLFSETLKGIPSLFPASR
jgi:hypothetical protein